MEKKRNVLTFKTRRPTHRVYLYVLTDPGITVWVSNGDQARFPWGVNWSQMLFPWTLKYFQKGSWNYCYCENELLQNNAITETKAHLHHTKKENSSLNKVMVREDYSKNKIWFQPYLSEQRNWDVAFLRAVAAFLEPQKKPRLVAFLLFPQADISTHHAGPHNGGVATGRRLSCPSRRGADRAIRTPQFQVICGSGTDMALSEMSRENWVARRDLLDTGKSAVRTYLHRHRLYWSLAFSRPTQAMDVGISGLKGLTGTMDTAPIRPCVLLLQSKGLKQSGDGNVCMRLHA